MKLLVIGGTVFLGRAVVEQALARGDEVTVFHRGLHGEGLYGDAVESVLGDRMTDLDRLGGRSWDAVVDTCGFTPEVVGLSAAALADAVERYVFVSTAGVYSAWPAAPAPDESAPTHQVGSDYSEQKAASERELETLLPGRVVHARAGVIVGPHENIGRLPYWLLRMARGGRVLAPGPASAPIQMVDARDLAAWMLALPAPGAYSAVAPPGTWTWGELLETCRDVAGPDAELEWVDGARVAAGLDDPWTELPLWPAPVEEVAGIYGVGADKARAAGLRIRPLRETVADTWAWLQASGGELGGGDWREEAHATGLSPERERELLA